MRGALEEKFEDLLKVTEPRCCDLQGTLSASYYILATPWPEASGCLNKIVIKAQLQKMAICPKSSSERGQRSGIKLPSPARMLYILISYKHILQDQDGIQKYLGSGPAGYTKDRLALKYTKDGPYSFCNISRGKRIQEPQIFLGKESCCLFCLGYNVKGCLF